MHLTTEELAKRWRMTPGSLANWRVAGKGPAFIKMGKKVLYPLDAVETYERLGSAKSTAETRVSA